MTRYNDYNTYLRNKYGCKVYKIGLDAGLSCPGRCIYCDGKGSRSPYTDPDKDVSVQLAERIEFLKRSKGAEKFIAYFQAFTNTYASVDTLKTIYDSALPFDEVVGISIGTRPDAVDRDKLKLISSYRKRFEAWIEYGLQSIHDKTLALIKRGHSFADFVQALKMAGESGIKTCAHVILGLPGETRDDMLMTARKLSELKIDAVKIHLLHILRGSALEQMYEAGSVRLLEQDEYVNIVCDFLENLSGDILIQRLTGQGAPASHVAPLWALDKLGTLSKIDMEFVRRKSCQGAAIKREEG